MKYSKELKIGVFIVVILVATFFVINYLRGKDILNKEISLIGYFDNVEGLLASAPVQIRGFEAGKVSVVEYDKEKDNFRVVCDVNKDFKIPSDSKLTLFSTSIMGGKGITIELGESTNFVSDGDELSTGSMPDLIGSLTTSIGPLLGKLNQMVDNLNQTVTSVNDILDESTRNELKSTIVQLHRTIANVEVFSKTVKDVSPELSSFVTSLTSLSDKLENIVMNADTTMSNISQFTSNLEKSDIEGLVESVKSLSDKIQNPDGTVGKLLNEKDVYESVDSLINQVNDLISKIKENPKEYLKISVF